MGKRRIELDGKLYTVLAHGRMLPWVRMKQKELSPLYSETRIEGPSMGGMIYLLGRGRD